MGVDVEAVLGVVKRELEPAFEHDTQGPGEDFLALVAASSERPPAANALRRGPTAARPEAMSFFDASSRFVNRWASSCSMSFSIRSPEGGESAHARGGNQQAAATSNSRHAERPQVLRVMVPGLPFTL